VKVTKLVPIVFLVGCAAQAQHAEPEFRTASAAEAGFSKNGLDSVGDFLDAKAAEGVFPGGVLVVGRGSGVVYVRTIGVYGTEDPRPVESTTIYDMASLTKVIGLTTATMTLIADGAFSLDDLVVDYVPEFSGGEKDQVTIRHLLTHTSGLPAFERLFEQTETPQELLARVFAAELEASPGERYTYSDFGAITMAQIVERTSGMTLDQFLRERIFEPLHMHDTQFRPQTSLHARIAPTEVDPWRGRLVLGEVHDENAYRLGGVSGHAGLFSTGPDLARFAIWLLDIYHNRLDSAAQAQLPTEVVRNFTTKQPGPEGTTRALGWDTPSPGGGTSSGHLLSPESFGHTGFTGTSIWVDPTRELFIILLTNRVNPTRENRALLPLRGVVADMVVETLVDE